VLWPNGVDHFCNNINVLEADQLECERGSRRLFRELSFTLAGGELLRVSGQNGSGKTSLLRILCGLLTPTQGEVRWKGTRIRDLAEEYSRELLYLGHAPAVKDDLTPAENLEIACRLAGVSFENASLSAALSAYSVPDLPVRKLSQGQRRRAALARLLLSASVPLWLLDEPFVALDPAASAFTEELLGRHVARGASVVYTTHQAAGIDSRARVVQL
jgi:heme exporter protein A